MCAVQPSLRLNDVVLTNKTEGNNSFVVMSAMTTMRGNFFLCDVIISEAHLS